LKYGGKTMKPSDFYLSVSDFFSIVVPGFIISIVVIVLMNYNLKTDLNAILWAILAVGSYIIGHILFAMGAWWDETYDKIKTKGNDKLISKITEIREGYADRDSDKINMYQWCRSVLSRVHPEGYVEVLRKEADSKLFRSIIIPLLVLGAILIGSVLPNIKYDLLLGCVSIVFSILAYWRYCGQRFKACKIAYTHVIVLFSLNKF